MAEKRVIPVELQADVAAYIRGMRDAGRETAATDDAVKGLGKSSEKTKPVVDGLGRSAKESGDKAKSAARNVENYRQELSRLDRQIAETTLGVVGLARAFARTGDPEVLAKLKQERAALHDLADVKKLLPDPDQNAAQSWGRKLLSGISSGLEEAASGSLGATAGTVLGVALAPTLGAAVSGAVVGAAGVGGVIGGVVLAARDPRVKQAGSQLGQFVLGDLEMRAQGFVPPVLDGIGRIHQSVLAMGPDLDRVFNSSRFVAPLVDGAMSGAQKFVHGFADAVDAADPVVESLRVGIDQLGGAVGQTFTRMAGDAKIGAEGVDELTTSVSSFITVTGDIVHGAAVVKGWGDQVDIAVDKARYWIEDNSGIATSLQHVGVQLDLTADGFKKGSAEAEAYRRLTLGTGTAADFAALKAAKMTDAQLLQADASGKARDWLLQQARATDQVAAANTVLIASDSNVKTAQQALTSAQQGYQHSLDTLSPKLSQAGQLAQGLRTAMTAMYQPMISATEANEGYESSWDNLSASIKNNKHSLDIHTAAGRANRDALEALITSTNEAYVADVASGVAVGAATKKHDDRIAAIREESRHLGLNKAATQELITTYGKIPPSRTTELLITGLASVSSSLNRLYVYQRSLAEGKSISGVEDELRKGNDNGPSKAGGGFDGGGWTGPGSKYQPAGVVHADEFVVQKDSRGPLEASKPGALDYMNRTGQWPGYDGGGQVAPVETRRGMPFRTNVSGTRIPSRDEVAAKVIGALGGTYAGGGSLGAWINAAIGLTHVAASWAGPLHTLIMRESGGNPRAINLTDSNAKAGHPSQGLMQTIPSTFGAYRLGSLPNDIYNPVANIVAGVRYIESRYGSIFNVQQANASMPPKGYGGGGLVGGHIAMQHGGVIGEPVVGLGASGRSYSFAENGPETVTPGAWAPASRGGTVVNNVSVQAGYVVSEQQLQNKMMETIESLQRSGRI